MALNLDQRVVEDFGREWSRFDQLHVDPAELSKIFSQYFEVFPWEQLPENPQGFDLGCGSGRWARFVAPRVARLHCIDPSVKALEVARSNLADFNNCEFHLAGVDNLQLDDHSMDFGYSLGVLHHVPDTFEGIKSCVEKLKPGAPLLLYLYYAFDDKPLWFKAIWKLSDLMRRLISRMPYRLKLWTSQFIAVTIYLPLARLARIMNRYGLNTAQIPLSIYKDKSFYTMRTDALDRFGTRLEKRFTQSQIRKMMLESGLERIQFGDRPPFWCAVGYKVNR